MQESRTVLGLANLNFVGPVLSITSTDMAKMRRLHFGFCFATSLPGSFWRETPFTFECNLLWPRCLRGLRRIFTDCEARLREMPSD